MGQEGKNLQISTLIHATRFFLAKSWPSRYPDSTIVGVGERADESFH